MRREPLHFDHLLLADINCKVKRSGSSWVPFDDLFPIRADTGEQFLSDYSKGQQERNEKVPVDPHNSRCQCNQCAGNVQDLPWKTMGEGGGIQTTIASTIQQERPGAASTLRIPTMYGMGGGSDDDDSNTGGNPFQFEHDNNDDNGGFNIEDDYDSGLKYPPPKAHQHND